LIGSPHEPEPTERRLLVMQLLIKIAINAVALVVAALIVPKFNLDFGSGYTGYIYVAVVAIVFGLVNAYIKPIALLVSLPLNLFALGLVGFIVNTVMLFLTTWVIGLLQSHPYILKLANFPPDLSVNSVVAAVLGSIVISIVSTVLSLALPD
jgi:putative membrane protein